MNNIRTSDGSLLQTLQLSKQPDVAGPRGGQLQVLLLQPPAAGRLRQVEMSGPWEMFEKLSCKVKAEAIIICVNTYIRTFGVKLHFNILIEFQVREGMPHMQHELYLDTRSQLQQQQVMLC